MFWGFCWIFKNKCPGVGLQHDFLPWGSGIGFRTFFVPRSGDFAHSKTFPGLLPGGWSGLKLTDALSHYNSANPGVFCLEHILSTEEIVDFLTQLTSIIPEEFPQFITLKFLCKFLAKYVSFKANDCTDQTEMEVQTLVKCYHPTTIKGVQCSVIMNTRAQSLICRKILLEHVHVSQFVKIFLLAQFSYKSLLIRYDAVTHVPDFGVRNLTTQI